MNRLTITFLVLLRLAIGWHFLFEGIEKLRTIRIGQTETNRPFSSTGYFREAQGPLGSWLKPTVGDPIQETHDLFSSPANLPSGQQSFPSALHQRWENLLSRHDNHYHFNPEQRDKARNLLSKMEKQFGELLQWNGYQQLKDQYKGQIPEAEKKKWLIREAKISFPKVETKVDQTLAQRIQLFNALYEEARTNQPNRRWQFDKDVEKQKYLKTRSELEAARSDLVKDLDEQTTLLMSGLNELLNEDQRKLGSPPPAEGNQVIKYLDLVTAYGLTIGGACLILGLLTRTNCLFLASFLFMTYLAVPPFPWLPVPPNTEGNYFYVNKNLIEMLALLALATTASGRWLGIDAILHQLGTWITGNKSAPGSPQMEALSTHN